MARAALIEGVMRRLDTKTPVSWLAALALAGTLGFAGPASATVTVDYILTPYSRLITTVSSAEDFFDGTGDTPTWLDGSLATPPVNYGGDTPEETLNIMRVEFPDDGNGNIIDGEITIILMDWFHPTDASVPTIATITGLNDTNVSGAVGTMVDGVVTSWSSDLTGLVHNELFCENIGTGMICGSFGLPASGTTQVDHDNSSTIAIDVLSFPRVASLPLTFSDDYQSFTMEATLPSQIGDQYYFIAGSTATGQLPVAGPIAQALMMGLLAAGGVLGLRRRAA